MSISEEKYVSLEKICLKVNPDLYDVLSWILILNLDLIPKEELDSNPNIRFSHTLMNENTTEATKMLADLASAKNPSAKHYLKLKELDPGLDDTQEISKLFFAFARRRIELAEKLGIRQI